MKHMRNYLGWCLVIGVMVSFVLGTGPVSADASDGYALLVQQSPADAGFVNPGNGVHKRPIGETVALSAVAKPGYRFMYWLGDVENSSSLDTTISIDSPKMVVAVFARENHDDLPGLGITNSDHYQGPNNYYNPVYPAAAVSPASSDYSSPDYPDYPTIEEKEFPVNDVPEPATMLLLGLGALITLRRKTH